jgi:hypothetical protein
MREKRENELNRKAERLIKVRDNETRNQPAVRICAEGMRNVVSEGN